VVDWCSMCKRSGESVDHLLLHCDVACALWSVLFSLFDVTWVMNGRVIDLLDCWKGQKVIKWCWRCGEWPLCALCGLFGGREIFGVSKIKN
jgi:hypothetical protein